MKRIKMGLKRGDKAPVFTLQNTNGEKVDIDTLIEQGDVLLLFFPLAFTSTCTEELCSARDNMKLYNALNTTVVGISVDSFFTLKEFKKANNLNFMLLSDFNRKVSEKYNCLYEDFFGMKGVSKRAAFVIGEDGIVKYSEVLDDAGELPNFKEIQKSLSA